jgi:membrane protein YdbS with pleckstrin-like domain
VTPHVEHTDPEGVDHGWVMQVTFVLAIALGAPLVAVLSLFVALPTWETRLAFAVRVGAVVWLCTAIGVYLYARWRQDADSESAESV